jgi:hypothetical protein
VTVEDAWLPDGAWQACAHPTAEIGDGSEVVLALDGSFSRDCTALVAVTVEDRPHVHLYRLWEAPEGARDWRVPVVQEGLVPRGAAVDRISSAAPSASSEPEPVGAIAGAWPPASEERAAPAGGAKRETARTTGPVKSV